MNGITYTAWLNSLNFHVKNIAYTTYWQQQEYYPIHCGLKQTRRGIEKTRAQVYLKITNGL